VQAWCTRTPPAIINSSLAAVYLWLAIAKAVSRLDDWSCLMQQRCVVHTHTSWRHQAASVVWASPGVERRDTWQMNCWYQISQRTLPAPHPWCLCIASPVFPTICCEAVCGLSDCRGWPDCTADCCLPSIGHD